MADDARVEVSIGARLDELISEMQKATQSVSASADKIADSVSKSMNQVEASSNEATAAIQRTQREAAESASGIQSTFSGLRSTISGMMGGLLAGVSVKLITDEIVRFADASESLSNTAQVVGTTATAISRLHAVATPMGIASDTVDNSMKRLAKTMTEAARGGEEQAAALAAVGLTAEQVKSMSIEDVLAQIADRFSETEDGATKTALAQALLGKSGSDLIPMLNQGSKAMGEQADEAERLGAVMGEDAVAAGAALDAALDKTNQAAMGFRNTMAQSLAPALQYIAEAFTEDSGAAVDFGVVFKGVASIVIAAVTLIKDSWNVVSSIVRAITVAIASIIDAIGKAAQMDFAGAKNALATGGEMMMEELTGMVERSEQIKNKFHQTMEEMWSDAPKPKDAAAAPGEGKGQLAYAPKGAAGDAAAAAKKDAEEAKAAAKDKFDYNMELLRNEFDTMQKGAQERLALAQQMTAATKAQYGEESAEYARAKRNEVKVAEEVENEKRRIQGLALDQARDAAEQVINVARGHADYMVATNEMTARERVTFEMQTQEELYQMQLSYLQKKLELMAMEPKEVERINAEIVRLKGEHVLQMQQTDIQHFQTSKAEWDNYFSVVNNAFSNSIQGMVFQGQTLREAWGGIMQSMVGSLIQTGVKMVTNWAATQLGMTTATTAGAAVRTAAEVASSKASITANAGAAIKNIMTKGAEVFANVYNAIAGIPYVGPFLAPVMAVAAGAAVVGMVGKVASAEGGWDRVPYDGAKAILHKEEMVLPAPLAEGIRGMVESGGAQRGGVTIQALDRRDVQRYFNDNNELMFGALMDAANNRPGGF